VIANALDGEPAEVRSDRVSREIQALTALGLDPFEIDLRNYFERGGRELDGELARCTVLWLRGGNVFLLRLALAASGADAAIVELVREDRVVYAGYSAGPCVLGPSLDGLDAVDDAAAVHRVHGVAPIMSGLGLVPFRVVPHVNSPTHPESSALDAVAERYRANAVEHITLRDGQALLIDGDNQEVVGSPAAMSELLY